MENRPTVAVIGGGISGMAAASTLANATGAHRPQVLLVEADGRLGGKVHTVPVAGLPVDTGPDAFLTRAPALRQLIESLGLSGAVVAPAASGSFVLSRGRLRALPPGTVFGVPQRLLPLLRSGLLSPAGVARAGMDLVLPRRRLPADPTVEQVLAPRFGAQVYHRLVEPLLGGVHAGRAHLLSARSTVPEIEAVARRHRSVFLGLRRGRAARPAQGSGPVLASIDGGLGRLVDALAATLPAGAARTGTSAVALERADGGYRITLAPTGADRAAGETVTVDAVVLATPAPVTADLLRPLAPAAATALDEIQHAGVCTVVLAYPAGAVADRLAGTGFLVPPEEGRLMVGCTWLSAKWRYLAGAATGAEPTVLIRCAVGRFGDERWRELDDEALVAAVHAELGQVMALTAPPRQAVVRRWPGGLPQYLVGHGDRVDRIEAAVGALPGLAVAGAAYRGVGLAGCVASAVRAAEATLGHLATLPPTTRAASPASTDQAASPTTTSRAASPATTTRAAS